MPQPRTPVTAPPAQPPRYGLVPAAPTVEDGDLRWTGGLIFDPEQCGVGGAVAMECAGSVGTAIDPARSPANVEADPFAVWAGDECSTIGFAARDWEGRARRQLLATESFQVASELWTGTLRDSAGLVNRALVDADSDTVTDGPTSVTGAIACLEYALGRALQGRRGMIHVTTQLLTYMQALRLVEVAGGLVTTALGTVVVADAGYDGSGPGGDPAGASQWAYATSMLQLRLGPVEVIGDEVSQIDRSVNTRSVVAVRPVAVQWDECAHIAAEVDLAVCLIGGAS